MTTLLTVNSNDYPITPQDLDLPKEAQTQIDF